MALPRYPTYRIPHPEYDEESQPLFFNPPEDPNQLPIKPIPGSYGMPFIGAIKDRWDFYYNQGRDGFFQARLEKYGSRIFRANAPPGPFIAKDPKVIVVLDALAFPVLFDMEKVEKRDIFDGTYMPSVNFTGGYRVLSFLDPSEPKHKAIKSFCFSLLASKKNSVIPVLRKSLGELFTTLETQLKGSESVEFNKISDPKAFEYVFNLFCGKSPAEAGLGESANKTVDLWLVPQIIPLVTLGLPGKILQTVEDLLIHTFPIPPFLVKGKYAAICKAYNNAAGNILDGASQFGLERDEALHNLIFITCFNTYGGLKVLFAGIFKWLGRAGVTWHKQIAKEVRDAVKQDPSGGGGVTLASLEKMLLVKSTVHEVLRIDPPVPFQYGKAKKDLILEAHDGRYEVKKGEMIFGYQPFATKDPNVFENPEEFVPYRFRGKAEANLKYVYWANGRETESPTTENKQCPGRDFVVLVARVLVAEFFLRYDTFKSTDKPFLVGSKVNFTSLTRATTAFTADLE